MQPTTFPKRPVDSDCHDLLSHARKLHSNLGSMNRPTATGVVDGYPKSIFSSSLSYLGKLVQFLNLNVLGILGGNSLTKPPFKVTSAVWAL